MGGATLCLVGTQLSLLKFEKKKKKSYLWFVTCKRFEISCYRYPLHLLNTGPYQFGLLNIKIISTFEYDKIDKDVNVNIYHLSTFIYLFKFRLFLNFYLSYTPIILELTNFQQPKKNWIRGLLFYNYKELYNLFININSHLQYYFCLIFVKLKIWLL